MTNPSISRPIALFNESNRIFYELPAGKMGKDGKISIQKGQEGNVCVPYAIKRLITDEQIRSEHGRICSKWRKSVTALGTQLTAEEYNKACEKTNRTFFEAKGKDPEKAAHEFWIETLKQGMAEVPAEFLTTEMLEEVIKETELQVAKLKPWYKLEQMTVAVHQFMMKGHGLKEIPCQDLMTIEKLIKTLQEKKGPLLIAGRFGQSFYANQEPIEFKTKVGSHLLYGWKKGTSTSEGCGIGHVIVLIGAEIKEGKNYVYWVGPEDPNDPKDLNSQRVFFSSFENFVSRMTTIAGLPMDQMTPQSRAIIAGALYNPIFTSS